MTPQSVHEYIDENKERYVDELLSFLKIPSISADSTYQPAMIEAAQFVHDQLSAAGLDAEIVETAGHPIVYGSWNKAEGAPTVLVYGHYDVQPADPLDKWETPPFEPNVRDDRVYARGATDDKGQLYTHIKSVEAWLKVHKTLPVNIKFVIEGEEEVGSNNLDKFLESRKNELAADVAVISDTSQYAPGIPAITYGLRGILACEVKLMGPSQDLHSGVFGGSISNPINSLAKIIGELIDDHGRIQIDGFYDDVIPLRDKEREQWDKLPFDEQRYLSSLGVDAACGEEGFTTTERRWARPTCDVNGIFGGYTGEGPKTIVPSSATAKLTCRLVPDQDPVALTNALRRFFEQRCPPGLRVDFMDYHGCSALVFDSESQFMQAAQTAIEKGFGQRPVMIREGGSIPVVATFRDVLGIDTLLLGWGQNTDNLHSPNEHFSLTDFHRGTVASAYLWDELVK